MKSTIIRMMTGTVIILLLSVSCSELVPVKYSTIDSDGWEVSVPEAQGLDSDTLSGAYQEARNKSYYYSLLVIRNGILISEEYFHGHDRNTRDDVFSVTKSYISALIGIAIQKGYIESVDSKLLDFFPEYVNEGIDPRKFDITIRHLLTMRSGFGTGADVAWETSFASNTIASIIASKLEFDPGTNFQYSTPGVHLLSGIITKTTGMSTFVFANKFLFGPLGCESVWWLRDQNDIHFGGYGMYLTPRDMARFGLLYLKNGVSNGREIVPSRWVNQSVKNYRGYAENWNEMNNLGYGYLWWTGNLCGHPVFSAVGYGGQWILVVPALEIVIVATMDAVTENNSEQSESLIKIANDYILPAVRE